MLLVYGAHLSAHRHFVFPYYGCQVTPDHILDVAPLQLHYISILLSHFFQFNLGVPQQCITGVFKSSNNSEDEKNLSM
jgi:hypothetical protein